MNSIIKENIPVVLGSASSERLLLLKSVGIEPVEVVSVDLDETELKNEKVVPYCCRITKEKFEAVAKIIKTKHAILITADTTSIARGTLLHKAYDDNLIRKYLELVSGRRHKVITAVCCGIVKDNKIESMKMRLVESTLSVKRLHREEIERFVRSKEGYGKAGGYTLKGIMACYVKQISGSYSSILGLPLYEVSQLISSFGYKFR